MPPPGQGYIRAQLPQSGQPFLPFRRFAAGIRWPFGQLSKMWWTSGSVWLMEW